jgi:hypothetical protein
VGNIRTTALTFMGAAAAAALASRLALGSGEGGRGIIQCIVHLPPVLWDLGNTVILSVCKQAICNTNSITGTANCCAFA